MTSLKLYCLFFVAVASSCNSSKVNKSKLWKNEYKEVANSILLQNKFDCFFKEELKDNVVKDFMRKENIEKICYNRPDEVSEHYTSVTFEFYYNPFFGKKKILLYKLDTDKKMEDLVSLIPTNRKIKKIDNDFLYIVIKSPGFGQ